MTQRDRATIHIQTLPIELQVAVTSDHLCRKCFVQFNEIDFIQLQIVSFQDHSGSRHGPDSHNLWRHTDNFIIDDPRERFSA